MILPAHAEALLKDGVKFSDLFLAVDCRGWFDGDSGTPVYEGMIVATSDHHFSLSFYGKGTRTVRRSDLAPRLVGVGKGVVRCCNIHGLVLKEHSLVNEFVCPHPECSVVLEPSDWRTGAAWACKPADHTTRVARRKLSLLLDASGDVVRTTDAFLRKHIGAYHRAAGWYVGLLNLSEVQHCLSGVVDDTVQKRRIFFEEE